MKKLLVSLITIGCLQFVLSSYAQVPGIINYQGRIVDSGTNFNGTGLFEFALVNPAGTTNYWSNDGTAAGQPALALSLTVTKGLYSVLLGDTTIPNMTVAISPAVFANSNVLLRVWFNDGITGFQQLTPDQRIAAAGYAMQAQSAYTAANLTGTISLAQLPGAVVTNGATGVNVSGVFSGDGSALTNVPGAVVWQPVASTNFTDAGNQYYLLTNNALTQVNLSASPSVGEVINIGGVGSNGFVVVPAAGQTIVGCVLAAGELWTEQIGAPTNAAWQAVASSSDGSQLAAAVSFGAIYTTTNFGNTWTEQTGAPTNADWESIASSSDGSHLAAAVYNGAIYTTTNFGNTWTEQTGAPTNAEWESIASSSDGSHLATVDDASGRIYTSTNSGATWTQTSAPNYGWGPIASSSDGSHLVAATGLFTGAGPLAGTYISTNSGATWTHTSLSPGSWWIGFASSSDGSSLEAVEWGGIWGSTDSGNTWTEQMGAQTNNFWMAVASSADGNYLVAGRNGSMGGIYLSSGGQSLPFAGVAGQQVQFQYVGNGVWQPSSTPAPVTAISSSQLPAPVLTNSYPTTGLAQTIINPITQAITVTGLKTLTGVLGGDGSGLFLSASKLSSGTIPQSVLPGFQYTCDTVGGGSNNVAQGGFATVPGGFNNTASGEYSFAAGYNAQATNNGAFVWSDGTGTPTISPNSNTVAFRASGGYYLFTGTNTAGAQLKAGATSWSTLSDRHMKKNFAPVNCEAILDKLAQIPIQQWNYQWENDSDTPNIGPMAQDFIAAFYPGRDNSSISTLEFDGVELAAIQGLNQELKDEDGRRKADTEALRGALKEKDAHIAALEKRLAALEAAVQKVSERAEQSKAVPVPSAKVRGQGGM